MPVRIREHLSDRERHVLVFLRPFTPCLIETVNELARGNDRVMPVFLRDPAAVIVLAEYLCCRSPGIASHAGDDPNRDSFSIEYRSLLDVNLEIGLDRFWLEV